MCSPQPATACARWSARKARPSARGDRHRAFRRAADERPTTSSQRGVLRAHLSLGGGIPQRHALDEHHLGRQRRRHLERARGSAHPSAASASCIARPGGSRAYRAAAGRRDVSAFAPATSINVPSSKPSSRQAAAARRSARLDRSAGCHLWRRRHAVLRLFQAIQRHRFAMVGSGKRGCTWSMSTTWFAGSCSQARIPTRPARRSSSPARKRRRSTRSQRPSRMRWARRGRCARAGVAGLAPRRGVCEAVCTHLHVEPPLHRRRVGFSSPLASSTSRSSPADRLRAARDVHRRPTANGSVVRGSRSAGAAEAGSAPAR